MLLSCAQDKVLISLAIQVSLQVLDDIDTEELDISIGTEVPVPGIWGQFKK